MRIDKTWFDVLLSIYEKDSANTRPEFDDSEHVVVAALGSRRL